MGDSLIASNLVLIKARIEDRRRAAGLDPSGVKIIGVTKTVSADQVREAVSAGLGDLGESRIQEALSKIPLVSSGPVWHMIGHLQKNKVRKAIELFDVIQSVDSFELAELISRRAIEAGKEIEIFLQLNSSGEKNKSGFDPVGMMKDAEKIGRLPGLRLTGLMTIGPLTDASDMIRGSFGLAAGVFERLKRSMGESVRWFSMGMSSDYELAIDFGANVVRIGSAIFGRRDNDIKKGER